ncbi:hypothetical protein HPB52_003618 [Rhipicephalus sanguineus]|uniref:DDE Tnp4 domain-containing protein n=1 Tax=Rhipicephalus sanguineus TaxID=34632 RepID=A0A9D4SVK6_RHISA|nr:hypothetical protein HPB52_003618 [Rhipicephalus sanguineus]
MAASADELVVLLQAVAELIRDYDAIEEGNDDVECHIVSLLLARLLRQDRHRVPLYVERVVPAYVDLEFKKMFRLSRNTAAALVEEFERSSFHPQGSRGRTQLSAEKTVLIGLTYLGTQTTMYAIADKFDVSEWSVHGAIRRVLDFLISISERETKWPDGNDIARSKRAFHALFQRQGVEAGLPDVIGPLTAATSASLDRVCNAERVFTHVFIGFPGRVHDARVLEESSLFRDGELKCEGGYLIGDSAYPLMPWLLPPYHKCGASWQPWMETFDAAHCRQRVVIEGAFGLLKTRFQRLMYVDVATIPQTVDIVMAACVLHNIASRSSDDVDDEQPVDHDADVSSKEPESGAVTSVLAKTVRDTVAQAL